jgi:hypothetical protein
VRSFEGASSLRKADGAPYEHVYSFHPYRCQHFRKVESRALADAVAPCDVDAAHPVFNFSARVRSGRTPHYGHIPPTFLGFLREVSDRGVSRRRRMIGSRLRPDDDVALTRHRRRTIGDGPETDRNGRGFLP